MVLAAGCVAPPVLGLMMFFFPGLTARANLCRASGAKRRGFAINLRGTVRVERRRQSRRTPKVLVGLDWRYFWFARICKRTDLSGESRGWYIRCGTAEALLERRCGRGLVRGGLEWVRFFAALRMTATQQRRQLQMAQLKLAATGGALSMVVRWSGSRNIGVGEILRCAQNDE